MSAQPEPLRGVIVRCRPNESFAVLKPLDARMDDKTRDVFFHASAAHGPHPIREGHIVQYFVAIDETGRTRAVDICRVK